MKMARLPHGGGVPSRIAPGWHRDPARHTPNTCGCRRGTGKGQRGILPDAEGVLRLAMPCSAGMGTTDHMGPTTCGRMRERVGHLGRRPSHGCGAHATFRCRARSPLAGRSIASWVAQDCERWNGDRAVLRTASPARAPATDQGMPVFFNRSSWTIWMRPESIAPSPSQARGRSAPGGPRRWALSDIYLRRLRSSSRHSPRRGRMRADSPSAGPSDTSTDDALGSSKRSRPRGPGASPSAARAPPSLARLHRQPLAATIPDQPPPPVRARPATPETRPWDPPRGRESARARSPRPTPRATPPPCSGQRRQTPRHAPR